MFNFFKASNDSLERSCSILHASSSAIALFTPNLTNNEEITWWRSYIQDPFPMARREWSTPHAGLVCRPRALPWWRRCLWCFCQIRAVFRQGEAWMYPSFEFRYTKLYNHAVEKSSGFLIFPKCVRSRIRRFCWCQKISIDKKL